jgi:PEP-CTERM/exosortase A-associated glycosyltransferase
VRVLHVLDHSAPLHSGYAFRSLSILRGQRALGWETEQLTGPKQGRAARDEEDVEGLRFFRTNWEPAGIARAPLLREFALMDALTRRLEDVVARTRPDVLHAHSPVLDGVPAIRVGRRRGIPVVYEVRAFWEDAAVDHGTAREWGPRYRASRALETWALRRAGAVTCICEGLRGDIVARGVPAQRVTVIPNAVDLGDFDYGAPPDEALKARLGLSGCTLVGFIGSFYAYEGLDLLLAAAGRIAAARRDVRVLLVGGGPEDEALRAAVRRLGIEGLVRFTGRVPHAEVAAYYSIIDVLAYPRHRMRLTDLVTPLKPLEAMAQGQLFVASDVGGHQEVTNRGEAGVLFRAGDAEALAAAVLDLLARRGEWTELRARARRFVERERSWTGSVARYAGVYGALGLPA